MNRDEASRPALVDAKGSRIGYAAIGIITNMLERHHATESKLGQIGYLFPADYKLVLDRLKSTETNYRILSIHYGIEGRVRTDATQIAEWRRQAALQNGIDLIIGHHAHVVRGVEVANKSVIFYGLGNFLHHGTANITGNAICRNYGLMAKVYLRKMPDGHLETKAIVAIPVTDTHMRPRRFNPKAGAAHIHALNYLGSLLDNAADGAVGVRFTPQEDGSGLYCFPDAGAAKDRIAKLCEHYTPAPPIPAALRGQIEGSCAG
jgi:poly-gamma-glutamate synthesis protein (capsule biosynthesis protein)